VKCREVPLLADRFVINKTISEIRKKLPVSSIEQVNRLYAKNISRAVHKSCPELGKLHEFRKFYAATCFHYFNERRCSLPRIAADYLGHKTMSETVLTYLSARIEGVGTLNFGRGKLAIKKDETDSINLSTLTITTNKKKKKNVDEIIITKKKNNAKNK
jgi:hypothetical protein